MPPSAFSAAVILASSLVLLGWLLNVELFKGILPGLPAMNPATAVCLMLAGIALRALPEAAARPQLRQLGRLCAVAVLVVGVLRAAAVVAGWDIGIDRLLFSSKLDLDSATGPNHMPLNTAASFILLGIALLLLDGGTKPNRPTAQPVAFAAAVGPVLALTAYAYGAREASGLGAHVLMSALTAVSIIILVAGILHAQPRQGGLAVLAYKTASGAVARRELAAALLVPFIAGWLWLQGFRAGLYEVELGVSLLIAVTVLMAVLGVRSSAWLGQSRQQPHTIAPSPPVPEGQLEVFNRLLADMASQDPLTGLNNRRALQSKLEKEIRRAVRYPEARLSVIILDVDHFKQYNDTYGHLAGDRVLQQLARYLLAMKRETDFLARYGGEEFAIVLPHTDLASALIVAERLRAGLADAAWPNREITASFGVATADAMLHNRHALLAAADMALYAAKAAGRNCVKHAPEIANDLPQSASPMPSGTD
jgi:diguanylate cyclase (GGDEF)-like protein